MRSLVLLSVFLAAPLLPAAAPPVVDQPEAEYRRLRKETLVSGQEVRQENLRRVAAHAEKYPAHPSAIEALMLVANLSDTFGEERKRVLLLLDRHYARSAVVTPLMLRDLGLSEGLVENNFLRQVGERNTDKRLRALAWRAMINGRASNIRRWEPILNNPRKGNEQTESIRRHMKAASDKWREEIDEARAKLKSPALAGVLADLSIGSKAPPTEAVDLDDNPVSLADHKGKVIVLDFWFIQCGPCRQLVPGANALIAELKGKPFAQIGVSVDENRATVSEYLMKTDMPWTHWWVGWHGKALETWDVEGYPTVYVIDHEGVIRHRQVGSHDTEKLYDLVRALVKKAEAARGK